VLALLNNRNGESGGVLGVRKERDGGDKERHSGRQRYDCDR